MDAVFYLLDAMRLFRGKSLQEIQEITFEIGMLGKYGLDINDPQESHVLRALPGRVFSALELGCILYAGFKRIEPGMDIGVDLAQEYKMAERLTREEIAIVSKRRGFLSIHPVRLIQASDLDSNQLFARL